MTKHYRTSDDPDDWQEWDAEEFRLTLDPPEVLSEDWTGTNDQKVWKRGYKETHANCSICPWNRVENRKAKPDRSWKRFKKIKHR